MRALERRHGRGIGARAPASFFSSAGVGLPVGVERRPLTGISFCDTALVGAPARSTSVTCDREPARRGERR